MTAEVGPFEDRLDSFERAWRESKRPPELRDFIDTSEDDCRDLLLELMTVDLEYRWRRDPTPDADSTDSDSLPLRPKIEDYVRVYSALGPVEHFSTDVICEEYRVRRRWGDRPNHADYLSRFPNQAHRLEQQLIDMDTELLAETGTDLVYETSLLSSSGSVSRHGAALGDVPERIGRYRIIGPLSQGGQARVFRAVHPNLSKELVIKIGHAHLPPQQRALLIEEGELLASFDHPNLAQVYDLDFEDGAPYLVIEYVRGKNLGQHAAEGTILPRDAARIVASLARAVDYIHARGVVHQDIKPGNAVIDEHGVPRLIDFGLAKLRDAWTAEDPQRTGISGTVAFMAPEQARGESELVGPASDVFALGAVLYYTLVGAAPYFDAELTRALDRAARCDFDKSALESPDVPTSLRQVCLKAMQKEPKDRYRSAAAMAVDLERIANPKKLPAYLAVVLVSVLVLGVAGYGMLWSGGNTEPAPVAPATLAQLSQHPQGRVLRQDFLLEMEMPGGDFQNGKSVVYHSNQKCAIYVQVDRPCYVGLWYVDGNVAAMHGDKLVFNRPVQPGDREEIIRLDLKPSTGSEFIHLVASTVPLAQLDGRKFEPHVVGAEPGDKLRPFLPVGADAPLVAEYYLQFEVRQ